MALAALAPTHEYIATVHAQLGTEVDVWAGLRHWLREQFDCRWWFEPMTGELVHSKARPAPQWRPFDG